MVLKRKLPTEMLPLRQAHIAAHRAHLVFLLPMHIALHHLVALILTVVHQVAARTITVAPRSAAKAVTVAQQVVVQALTVSHRLALEARQAVALIHIAVHPLDR